MKYVRLLSDIHYEFRFFELDALPTDSETILILAGDIGTPDLACLFINEIAERFEKVIYVLGNHEYYKQKYFETVKNKIKDNIKFDNVYVFDKADYLEIDNYFFLCGTLWTDFNKNDKVSKLTVENGLYDYRLIYHEDMSILTTDDTYIIHNETLKAFETFFGYAHNAEKEVIIVTHHMPSECCVAPQFKNSYHMNAGFRSELEPFILEHKPKYWFFGHGHNTINITLENTILRSNPRGYPRGFSTMENNEFDPNLVIEL